MYLLLVHCLFERFVNLYLFSMFVNNDTCCASVLLFRSNCPYKCRNNCQMFAIRHVWYNAFVNLQCFIKCCSEIMKSFSCRMGFYFVCQLEWYFTFMQSLFFLWWKLHVFGYWTFVWSIDFYSNWQGQGPYTV